MATPKKPAKKSPATAPMPQGAPAQQAAVTPNIKTSVAQPLTRPLPGRTAAANFSTSAWFSSLSSKLLGQLWPARNPHQAQLDEVKASVLAELSQRGQPQNLKATPFSGTANPLSSVTLPSKGGASTYQPTPWWVWATAAGVLLIGVWLLLLQTPTPGTPVDGTTLAEGSPPADHIALRPAAPSNAQSASNMMQPEAAPASARNQLLPIAPLKLAQAQRILGADGRLRWTLTLTNAGQKSIPAQTLSSFIVADAVGQPLASTFVQLTGPLAPGQSTVQTVLMPLQNNPVHRAVVHEPLEAFQLALHGCC